MAWATKIHATQLTGITATEQFFDEFIELDPGETAHCEIEANPPATPTDHLVVSVYNTLDDSSENWDDTPYLQFYIDKGIDPNKASFTISGVYRFRIGVKRSGVTDTYVADLWYRTDGIAL